MKHFAVATLGDTPLRVAETVIRTAASKGYTFSKIESMDRTTVGSTEFQRFRVGADPTLLLTALFKAGRAVVGPDGTIKLEKRTAKVPPMFLFAASRESVVYRGPGEAHWESQFG